MSQTQHSDLSMLGMQLDELQTLLERRLDEERQTRQQTLVGLERWISERLAERDKALTARFAATSATAAPSVAADMSPSPLRNGVHPPVTAGAADSEAVSTSDVLELSRTVHALREHITALEAQVSFLSARQDEFTVLLATVREWVAGHTPVPTQPSGKIF